MKKSVFTLALSLALGLSLSSAQTSFAASETGTRFPAPSTVSAEMAESVSAPLPELWLTKEKSPESVSALAQNYAEGAAPAALALAKEYGVDVQEGTLGGVRVYTLTPEKLAKDKPAR